MVIASSLRREATLATATEATQVQTAPRRSTHALQVRVRTALCAHRCLGITVALACLAI